MSIKAEALEARMNDAINRGGPILANGSASTAAGGTTEIAARTIPGGTPGAGGFYKFMASGTFSTGATPPTSVTFQLNHGPVGNASSGSGLGSIGLPAAGLWGGAASAPWVLRAWIAFNTSSQVEAGLELLWRTASGLNNGITYHARSTTGSLTTGSDRDIDITFAQVTGGNPMTFAWGFAHWRRVG